MKNQWMEWSTQSSRTESYVVFMVFLIPTIMIRVPLYEHHGDDLSSLRSRKLLVLIWFPQSSRCFPFHDSTWFNMIYDYSRLFKIQDCSALFNIIQHHSTLFNIIQHYSTVDLPNVKLAKPNPPRCSQRRKVVPTSLMRSSNPRTHSFLACKVVEG